MHILLTTFLSVLVFSFDTEQHCSPNQGVSKWYYGDLSSRGCGEGCAINACQNQGLEAAAVGHQTERGVVYVCCYDPNSGPCDMEARCRSLSTAAGLTLGGAGYSFKGHYDSEGCYYYPKDMGGAYAGKAFFGIPDVYNGPRKKLVYDSQRRLPGWNCIPAAGHEESVGSMGALEGPEKAAMASEAVYMQQTQTPALGHYVVNGFALLGMGAMFYGAARFYIK